MSAHERAQTLVREWTKDVQGKPIGPALEQLQHTVARALDDVAQSAYERGLRSAVEFQDQEPAEQMQALVALSGQAGAEGVWLLRGIANPDLVYNVPGDGMPTCLTLEDADLLFLARFPLGDGKESGIEYHGGADGQDG